MRKRRPNLIYGIFLSHSSPRTVHGVEDNARAADFMSKSKGSGSETIVAWEEADFLAHLGIEILFDFQSHRFVRETGVSGHDRLYINRLIYDLSPLLVQSDLHPNDILRL